MSEPNLGSGSGPVVGVRTTRIYCRPVCRPSRPPKPENCVPFASADDAKAAGYRPCKLCRPDDPVPPQRKNVRPVETVRHGIGPCTLGHAFVGLTDAGVCALLLYDEPDPAFGLRRLKQVVPGAAFVEDRQAIEPVLEQINAFLAAGGASDGPKLDLRGTPFQQKVWEALRQIPAGTTRTYGELAAELDSSSPRAVGTACGANPIALFVPCHRVLTSTGKLGGYRWGLDRKRQLLEIENALAPTLALSFE